MNITIISDTHLSHRFDVRKYKYLVSILASADRVIINGDFWDGYLTSFDQFVTSPWKKLFPLLKKKKALYLFGNHDKREYSDTRIRLFCTQAHTEMKLDFGRYRLHIEHGDRVVPLIDSYIPWVQRHAFLTRIAQNYERVGLSILGTRFLLLEYTKHNNRMKEYARTSIPHNAILLCGHSHLPELSLSKRFANSGFINHGYGSYLRIDKDELSLIREQYE
ncbi:MAG: metallophosphatase family protein [Candidatus Roizmanbacteria bacterium]|nr:metallophosphatase family protein [Candidatus Roizmanbacteria bacterium]